MRTIPAALLAAALAAAEPARAGPVSPPGVDASAGMFATGPGDCVLGMWSERGEIGYAHLDAAARPAGPAGRFGTTTQSPLQLEMAPDGVATAIFGATRPGEEDQIYAARGGCGRAFEAPVLLGRTGFSATADVATSPAGETFVAWSAGGDIMVSIAPPGGAFAGAQRVPGHREGFVSDPQIVFDPSGDALLLFHGPDGPTAARRPAGGRFGTARPLVSRRRLSRLHVYGPLDLASGPAGELALAAWAEPSLPGTDLDDGQNSGAVVAVTGTVSGGFDRPHVFRGRLLDSAAAVDAAGTAVVAYRRRLRGGRSSRVELRAAPRGRRFGRPRVVSPPGAGYIPVPLAVTGRRLTIVWTTRAPHRRVLAATGRAGGDFGPPQVLSPPEVEDVGVITTGGATIAAWTLAQGRRRERMDVQLAVQPRGRRFGRARTVFRSTRAGYVNNPAWLYAGPGGRAVVTWTTVMPSDATGPPPTRVDASLADVP